MTNQEITRLIKKDPEKVMQYLYQEYYAILCGVVSRMIHDNNIAEDIVQEVLMEIWKKRDNIHFSSSIFGYLKRACVNRTLNYIRKNKVKLTDEAVLEYEVYPDHIVNEIEAQDLKLVIKKALDQLPDRCRQVFVLSRYEDLTYKEIGTALDITTKTVENQIAKALKIIRTYVSPYFQNSTK